jgi:hypothetical protein
MVERATGLYNTLFEVRLLHHYWLDDGTTMFDALASNRQAERLLAYDVRSILSVSPTPSTRKQLDGLRAVFKSTGQGFVVAAPDGTTVAADTTFSFVVSVADGQLLNYTALTFRPWGIYEAFDPSDNTPARTIYRYKENVPVLSNLTGAIRGSGADAALFLSRDYPAPNASDQVEAFVLSGAALLQLTSDNPAATTQQLGADATQLPVYVNQGDAPVIAPPAGVTGAPPRGVQLSNEVPDDVFALIGLVAVRGDNDAFSFVDAAGKAKMPAPIYQARFKNRSTVWTYFDKKTGAVSETEPKPLPLTYFGNAGAGQKPSRGEVKANQSAGKITQLVSAIYI